MRQLLYISSSHPRGAAADIAAILGQSQRNNCAAGVTGLLWTDGVRFLQVLEGEADAVAATYARIAADPRHTAIVVLADRTVAAREFGDWSMARRGPGDTADGFDARMQAALGAASPAVRGTFMGLIAARRAA
ncbi:Sensors of blue-light using FAD [Sphingomonas sp. EC-HK361]|uniref:BLUF domain-containing protein n=1 Tax=Sphingomonas sp. EC-HK361 TaxID=2038397 RepID=UPI0012573960|nr:BLUF domain-containing protein [Sphingomonas sp. EC-HK361]VVT13429.1 Sensors of blue-light using FAD [Sphingomonas sp. EC-HK361]